MTSNTSSSRADVGNHCTQPLPTGPVPLDEPELDPELDPDDDPELLPELDPDDEPELPPLLPPPLVLQLGEVTVTLFADVKFVPSVE
jgi:hypothetical protein